jgi:hypothetical protein
MHASSEKGESAAKLKNSNNTSHNKILPSFATKKPGTTDEAETKSLKICTPLKLLPPLRSAGNISRPAAAAATATATAQFPTLCLRGLDVLYIRPNFTRWRKMTTEQAPEHTLNAATVKLRQNRRQGKKKKKEQHQEHLPDEIFNSKWMDCKRLTLRNSVTSS